MTDLQIVEWKGANGRKLYKQLKHCVAEPKLHRVTTVPPEGSPAISLLTNNANIVNFYIPPNSIGKVSKMFILQSLLLL